MVKETQQLTCKPARPADKYSNESSLSKKWNLNTTKVIKGS